MRYDSVYLGLYLAPDDIRNEYLVKEEGLKDKVLYLEKFPQEFKKILSLKEVEKGFNQGFDQIGKEIAEKSKNIKVDESKNFPKKEEKIHINLERKGSFEWGDTYLRIKLNSAKVTRTQKGYDVSISYTTRMFDEFNDVADWFDIKKGNQELKGGKPFNMATRGITTTRTFSVKSLEEITEKMK